MKYRIVWGGEFEDVLITTSGDASVQDLDAMVQEAIADERFRDGLRVLIDHSNTRWWPLSDAEIEERADLIAEDAERLGRQRVAFVAGSPVDERIGEALQRLIAGRAGIESKIFGSVQAARDWLSSSA